MNRQTDMSQNITFPQLLWWVVKIIPFPGQITVYVTDLGASPIPGTFSFQFQGVFLFLGGGGGAAANNRIDKTGKCYISYSLFSQNIYLFLKQRRNPEDCRLFGQIVNS